MKYFALLLFLFCGAVNAQAQCPDTVCHSATNPPPPMGPYWVYNPNPTQSFQNTCGGNPPPSCDGKVCNECRDVEFQWRGCCPLTRVQFQFTGCARLCGEVVIPTYPAWEADNPGSCVNGPIVLSTNNSSDALQTCKWFRIRVCGHAGSMTGMPFTLTASDCNGGMTAVLMGTLP
jgi:hypothetical protein